MNFFCICEMWNSFNSSFNPVYIYIHTYVYMKIKFKSSISIRIFLTLFFICVGVFFVIYRKILSVSKWWIQLSFGNFERSIYTGALYKSYFECIVQPYSLHICGTLYKSYFVKAAIFALYAGTFYKSYFEGRCSHIRSICGFFV